MPKRKIVTVDPLGRPYLREEGMEEDAVATAATQDAAQEGIAKKAAGGVDVGKFSEPEPAAPAADAGLAAQAEYQKKKREWTTRRAAWMASQVKPKPSPSPSPASR